MTHKMSQLVDVMSSDIFDEDQEKCDYARSISRENTTRFRLVHTLLKSNSLTFSIVVLCCEKFGLPQISCGLLLI
jgi:hypothetical protein